MSGDPPFAPLFLLADSQLLFRGAHGPSILERARHHLPRSARCAYLGAANGDDPVFFELFQAAVEGAEMVADPGDARMVESRFRDEDREWLEGADLVVLAGGDVERGWRLFEQAGVPALLQARYAAGAVLLGVSAGAVHLGWGHLHLVPALVGAHEEADDWADLRRRMAASREGVRGLGVPTGGGLIYHPDGTAEAVRRPVHELTFPPAGESGDPPPRPTAEEIRENLLLPPGEGNGHDRPPDEPVN